MPRECQVDFYLLSDPSRHPGHLACRLALMAWERGHEVSVITASETDARALDELMWDFPADRFLAHEVASGSRRVAPVTIHHQAPEGTADVVINLTDQALADPGRFNRLLEIVPFRDADRKASREKFKIYRAEGLEPSAHEINQD